MGIIRLLILALKCIHFLAWPAIALGYPLFASIRAVETGSVYRMRKLVIYWTLFSLVSLLEISFVKIIEWIPVWSSMKLVAIFWIVMPNFDGACLVYQSLVHPVLFVNLQAVIDRFYKLKEEKLCKRETFLDVAEKYIKENGTEALEKIIANKYQRQEHENSRREPPQVLESEGKDTAPTAEHLKEHNATQKYNEALAATKKTAANEAKQYECQKNDNLRDSQVIEPERKEAPATAKHVNSTLSASATAKHLEEPDTAQKDIKMFVVTKETAATEVKQQMQAQHARSVSAAWDPKGTDAAPKAKEMTPPEASAQNRRLETPPVEKAQRAWTCDLCKVTTTSETTLNAHFRGSKHKSQCEALKESKFQAKDPAPSPSVKGKPNQGNLEAVKSKVGQMPQKESSEKAHESVQIQVGRIQQDKAKQKQDGGANQAFKRWCNVCNVKLLSDIDLESHVKGKRHLSNIKEMANLQGMSS